MYAVLGPDCSITDIPHRRFSFPPKKHKETDDTVLSLLKQGHKVTFVQNYDEHYAKNYARRMNLTVYRKDKHELATKPGEGADSTLAPKQ